MLDIVNRSVNRSRQRMGPLAFLPEVLEQFGVPLSAVLDGLPISPGDFRPETFLPLRLLSDVLDRSAVLTGCAELGVLLGERHNHRVFGPLGQVMAACDTLGAALATFTAFQMANSTAAAAYLHCLGDEYALGYGIYDPELGSSLVYDISVSVGCRMLHDLTGGAVTPVEVLLSRSMPADGKRFRQHFRCPVRFDQPQSCVILTSHDMAYPLPLADPARRENLLRQVQQHMAAAQVPVASRVAHALRPHLLLGTGSLPQIAAHLGVAPRTLVRHLNEENTSFSALTDKVRFAVSRELLGFTALSASDIATTLGYATPSAFVRAFRRWAGQSPTAWREAARNGKAREFV